MRVTRLFILVLLTTIAIAIPKAVCAQDDLNFETGIKPFAAYNGGNIDTVSLFNGTLNLDIPLISYPQRGGKLKLEFHLRYADVGSTFTEVSYCYPPPIGCVSYPAPASIPGWCGGTGQPSNNLPLCHGFKITDESAEAVQEAALSCPPQGPCTGDGWILDASGATHQLLPTAGGSTTTWESVDGTAFRTVTPAGSGTYSVTDSGGTLHTWPSNYVRQDTNGNTITYSSTAGWSDTLNRVIPPVPAPTSNVSNCPTPPSVPLAPTSSTVWNPPGVSGGTYPITLCYIQLSETNPIGSGASPYTYTYTGTELQSVVLPDGTSWTFEYTTDGNADLAEVIFPTGGLISYSGYSTFNANPGPDYHRAVTSRTLNPNDGITPASTWNYSYSSSSNGITTIVSAPPSNGSVQDDTVHIFAPFSSSLTAPVTGGNGGYETTAQYYQGSHTSGVLLKTVNTQYYWTSYGCVSVCSIPFSIVPQTVTTIWANGQQAQTKYQYDTNLSYYLPWFNGPTGALWSTNNPLSSGATYGRLLYKYDYDYSGSLLRTTTTSYVALSNSSYLTANLLALPSLVQVTGSGSGLYTTYGYDESGSPQGTYGNLTSVHRWLNTTNGYLVTNSVYNSNGLLTSSTDPKNNRTTYGYSGSYAGSGPTSVTNALGQTTNYAYDFNTGLLTSATDPNSRTTSYAYDEMLRPAQINNPDGGLTTFSYPNPNQVDITEKISSSLNRLSYLMVDGVGREIRGAVTNGEPGKPYDETDTCYDGLGRVGFKSYPFQDSGPFATSRTCASPELGDSFASDSLSRTIRVTHSDFSYITTSYSGNTTTVTDEQGKARERFVDGLGRLTQVIEDPGAGLHLNYSTNYAYDALDNLISVVQSGSRSRSFVYDSLSRLTSSTNPESNWSPASQTSVSTTYAYDVDGNLINKTEPAQNQQSTSLVTLTYCYDALNRMTAKGYTAQTCTAGTMPTPVATYAYDGNAPVGCSVGSFGYGLAIGKRTATCDAAGSEAWAYNIVPGVGWQTTDQRTTNSITKTSLYQGDLLGSPLSIQYPSGRTINYTPNAADRPTSATDAGSGLNYASNAHYAANGTQCWDVLGGVTTVSEALNSRLQPNQMQAINSVVGYPGTCGGLGLTGNLLDLSYNFNLGSGDNGNVMGIVNNRDTTRSQAFTYDTLNRLAQATAATYAVSPAHCWGESYQYDNQQPGGAWGNLTGIGVASSSYNGCTQESLSLSVDTNNRINSSGYGYDTAGNMIVAPPTGTGYSFNAENQMVQAATFAGTTGYLYDGDGKRVAKTVSGTPFKLYWYDLSGNVLDETDATGSTSNSNSNEYIFFGGKRIARRTD